MVSASLSPKGVETRSALETAARKLFADRGFHATTVLEITSLAGKSPAAFYRYFDDKQHLLATLAESFLQEVLLPYGAQVRLPESPHDTRAFEFMVARYWDVFKPETGILAAVHQLAPTQPRFAQTQARIRQFSIDVVTATVERAQQHGYADDLNAHDIALALAALFEQFSTEVLQPNLAHWEPKITDDAAVLALATIWKKTLYGFY
ncbi:TetR/AcrR family transcriptional regulator [Mycobacterium sp. CVI_P3]|uniref:TetR/AcrR family transcriptional regulator n=1 Tax=Mycobacterium pinniadriaticum TaxID=2994102 RepID=A0ABT3SQN9_9MYCO|nr:TetR/AcrR family transcriptional regulator [Mycobacterium pinniadriaticum]MCX2934801.1 TetR/AcrR family transcriptional regulator [Mycobacterium pinniadriaticum]MCX2941200.1 TetR/AcrR family transcriptional regulator [Mycobacterium pinniadriaticum]